MFHLSVLPAPAQSECVVWRTRMEQLIKLGRGWTTKAPDLAAEWGVSVGTLTRRYYAFKKHGAAGLVDKKKYGSYLNESNSRGLPVLFIKFWHDINLQYQRENESGKAAYRHVIDQLKCWRRGDDSKAIPGYDYPPLNAPGANHPHGWSYHNLMNQQPDDVAKSFRRRGRLVTKEKYLPLVYTTRVGMKPGQVITIDDEKHDVTVAWNGGTLSPPLAFDVIDYVTTKHLLDGIQPIIEDENTGKKIHLKTQDAFWLLLTHFSQNGYRANEGTLVPLERGTATLSTEIIQGFKLASNGKIICEKTGVDNRGLNGFRFESPAKGNPRFKASHESLNRLVRIYSGYFLGQTGRNKDEAPEEQASMLSYVKNILRDVPRDRWHLLTLPILTEDQFRSMAWLMKQAINKRTDHTLEGWEKNGWVQPAFRLPSFDEDTWLPITDLQATMMNLPTAERAALMAQMSTKPLRLSPHDVWEMHKHELTKLKISSWNLVIPAHMAHIRHVEDNREIRLYGLGPDVLRYDAICHNAQGRQIMLKPQDQVMIYCNPLMPDEALCCDTNGAGIGIIHRIKRFNRTDTAGFLARAAQVKEMTADIEAPIANNAAGIAQERKAMIQHNERVKGNKPVTKEEHERDHKHRAAKRKVTAWIDTDAEPDQQPETKPVKKSTPAEITSFFDE